MSPDVFSPQAKKWGFQISLPERLFYDYKSRQSGQDRDPNLIFLSTNYRSNERLLKFSSDIFYGGELSSGSSQPLHPQLGPLVFYAALGKEEIEENRASYRNLAEVNEVVKRVKELSDSWPDDEWGKKDLKQIAVVSSYRYQVKTIRDGLRKVGLGDVDVETIENVQAEDIAEEDLKTLSFNIPVLSEYAKALDKQVKRRYLEKISVVGVDPVSIPSEQFDPECLPQIESTDLLGYLVLETSFYTRQQFKAYKSLEAFNQMVSGDCVRRVMYVATRSNATMSISQEGSPV
ncbi:PREDICTED: probable helicase with zinc finger domain [Acropora digitifera]|uniref:probable helicase with zinc finger domain n=1 Tax=Acropora digitifera TaxID=70779 RepID=UPI00077AEA42|nr:PREDICTED: probable helicase with zinc finger domain [Acropora digitifera]